eukprot:TRINITY_DN29820_c0_g2_i1.p5 TRINITY_DN29820_c0_g2~~TRINITY_DN29820_c0_g2_i1.p5  ORF type:complete len:128 (+),score=13.98 TRINITY_DN29820_c0_g2_i1:630-1013(+)
MSGVCKTAFAVFSPTPFTLSSSSFEAAMMLRSDPNSRRRSRAAFGPISGNAVRIYSTAALPDLPVFDLWRPRGEPGCPASRFANAWIISTVSFSSFVKRIETSKSAAMLPPSMIRIGRIDDSARSFI